MSPRVRSIIEQTAIEHGVSMVELMSRKTHRKISLARQDAMRRLRALCKTTRAPGSAGDPFSFAAIGRIFGRDHTTVMQACGRLSHKQPKLSTGRPFPVDTSQLSHSQGERSSPVLAA